MTDRSHEPNSPEKIAQISAVLPIVRGFSIEFKARDRHALDSALCKIILPDVRKWRKRWIRPMFKNSLWTS